MGEMRNVCKNLVGNVKGRDHLVGERIMLKWILKR
jgi:hypothetical protein